MVARADILAGRAVILVNIQDTIDKQLRGIRSKFRMFANGMSEIGGDLFRGGLAATFASVFPVKEFINFQDQILFLQTKLQSTDMQTKLLEKTIRHLGTTTSFTSKEVAQAATMYAQAGFSIEEIQKSLQAALDLARGSQIDLTTSTTILSNALRTFQKDASNAADFASKFTVAARLGTLNLVDLGESLKYSSGTFANLGVEIENVLGLISTLSLSGLKASLAGTSLNTAFLNLASSAEKLRNILGVELTESDFKNPLQALRKMEVALNRFSKIEQAGILQDLVNIRGGRAISGLLLQGLDRVEANITAIKAATDEARQSALKLDSALGGVWRKGLSALQELLIAIGETSEGPLTKFGTALTKHFQTLSKLTETNQVFVQQMLLLGPASLAAGVGILGLSMIIGKLAMFITPIMMLNNALFSIAGALVGANVKVLSDLFQGSKLGIAGLVGKPDVKFLDRMSKYMEKIKKAEDKILASQTKAMSSSSLRAANYESKLLARIQKDSEKITNNHNESIRKIQEQQTSKLTQLHTRREERLLKIKEAAILKEYELTHTLSQPVPERVSLQHGGLPLNKKELQRRIAINQKIDAIEHSRLQTQREIAALQQKAIQDRNRILAASLKEETRIRTSASDNVAKLVAKYNVRLSTLTKKQTAGIIKILQDGAAREASITLSAQKKIEKIRSKVAPTDKSSFMTKDRGPGFFAGLISIFKELGATVRRVFSLDFQKMYKGFDIIRLSFRSFLITLKGVFTILNGIRRILFSLSGWLLIAEMLFLFGDKIPVIKDMLSALGNAFSNLGGNLADMFRDIQLEFGAFTSGFRKLVSGDLEGGINDFTIGIRNLSKVIQDSLIHSWQTFVHDIKPGLDTIKIGILGTIEVFKSLGAVIGAVFGTIGQEGKIIFETDGSLLETIKSIFSPDNMKVFFAAIIGAIGSIGQGLISVIQFISAVLTSIKDTFLMIAKGLASLPFFDKDAKKGIESLEDQGTNDPARASYLRNRIAQAEDILFGQSPAHWLARRSTSAEDLKKVQENLNAAKAELLELTGSSNLKAPIEDIRAALQAKIDKMLNNISNLEGMKTALPSPSRQDLLREEAQNEFSGIISEVFDDFDPLTDLLAEPIEGLGNVMEDLTVDLEAERQRLREAILTTPIPVVDIEEQAAAVKALIPAIDRAVVGGFQETRNALLLAPNKMETLAERQAKAAEAAEDHLEDLAQARQPFVFNA